MRLGHFSLPALRIYFPSLLKLMNLWSLIVKLSVLVVLVTSFLLLHNNSSSVMSSLIHSDIWGHAPIKSNGYCYFVAIIDDATQNDLSGIC